VEARTLQPNPVPPPPRAGERRVVVVVCDSLGVGAAADAAAYGDEAADTLGNVSRAVGGLELPTLGRWGIGWCTEVEGVPPRDPPEGVVGVLEPTGAGKDSTTGHWELMGVRTDEPFPLYPDGFPPEVIRPFEAAIGHPVLGNRPASGTVIIEELGEEHLATGAPIVYTSGDSVFQVAAHTDVVPLERLYDWCETARGVLTGEHAVGRVIARPFTGSPGTLERTTERRDYSLPPPGTTVCDIVHRAGVPVKAVGKIEDLFVERGITVSSHTGDDESALAAIDHFLDEEGPALIVANLVDLDQRYGHRNDPDGYAEGLRRVDTGLGALAGRLVGGDRLLVTGDHGTDPTIGTSTDHTRERVPAVAYGPGLAAPGWIGRRRTMADVGATVLDLFGLEEAPATPATSFADRLG
jgi:phosphopentomutase